MPIENEVKYALKIDNNLITELCNNHVWYDIKQGYLPQDGCRIRKKEIPGKYPKFVFTYKLRLKDGETMEIETFIEEEDFDKLWNHCKETLRKRRITIKNGNETWDIDFFFDGRYIYFAMAECEMPAGRKTPKEIPEILKSFIKKVPFNKYTSKKLCDIRYGYEQYKKLFG